MNLIANRGKDQYIEQMKSEQMIQTVNKEKKREKYETSYLKPGQNFKWSNHKKLEPMEKEQSSREKRNIWWESNGEFFKIDWQSQTWQKI